MGSNEGEVRETGLPTLSFHTGQYDLIEMEVALKPRYHDTPNQTARNGSDSAKDPGCHPNSSVMYMRD